MSDPEILRINGERLWASLMTMAKIGATSGGGCDRLALTDLDREARDLFVSWCEEAGCKVHVDPIGNIFARRAGSDSSLPSVLAGSHLDTQPSGGRFDGVYGVLAGLEVVRTLNDAGFETSGPIDIVSWTNEEGARFAPAMLGSGVWAGEFSLEESYQILDKQGLSIGTELQRIGYRGDAIADDSRPKAAFEVHIEQGPVLEKENLQIGVVTGVQGIRWYDLVVDGQSCHAGTTPMDVRTDPVKTTIGILAQIFDLIDATDSDVRVTFGDINTHPGTRNTVPDQVNVTVDLRHPDDEVLQQLESAIRGIVSEAARSAGFSAVLRDKWGSVAIKFNDDCIAAVSTAIKRLGYSHRNIVSGAGHDAVYVSRVSPTSMIFVPCENGLSHTESENAKPEDIEAGCNVLLHAMLDRDRN